MTVNGVVAGDALAAGDLPGGQPPGGGPELSPFDFAKWRRLTELALAEGERRLAEAREAVREATEAIVVRERELAVLHKALALVPAVSPVPGGGAPAGGHERRATVGAERPRRQRRRREGGVQGPRRGGSVKALVLTWAHAHHGELILGACAEEVGLTVKQVRDSVWYALKAGRLERVGVGHYRLRTSATEAGGPAG